MKVLAIIPARGGSKGIPMKNIRKLAGIPLIEHTISVAKKSKIIDKILVSTDSNKIAYLAKSAGAEVPFLRPKKLSDDNTSILTVIKHTLRFLAVNELYEPEIILLLQPTSPLRTSRMIDKSVEILKKSNATCVIGVSRIKSHPYNAFWYKNKYLRPFKSDFQKYYRRQQYPVLYYPTGSIYTLWNKTLKRYNSIYGPRIKPLIIDEEFNIDIDSKFDLFLAEMQILHWKNHNKKFN